MKLYLYLHGNYVESYLQEDYFTCFNISDRAPDGDDWVPDHWIYMGEVDVEIDVDEKKIRQIAVANLDEEISQKRAIAEKAIQELEDRKQKLLALEVLK